MSLLALFVKPFPLVAIFSDKGLVFFFGKTDTGLLAKLFSVGFKKISVFKIKKKI